MSNKYRPSNGTEGMRFTGKFCDNCLNMHPDPSHPRQCMILCNTMCYDTKDKEYPEEWTYDENGEPTCTAFIKWDWGKDDDGNWIEPVIPPPVPDNQLTMPFIFDEIGVKKVEAEELTLNL